MLLDGCALRESLGREYLIPTTTFEHVRLVALSCCRLLYHCMPSSSFSFLLDAGAPVL